MAYVPRFDHVGVTVADLDQVTEFFLALGLEVQGRGSVEGDFIDTVCGIPGSATDIVMLQFPGGGTTVELSRFRTPPSEPGMPEARANVLGIRSIAFEVDDLRGVVDRVAELGYGLDGGIGEYENIWRMAYVRGPEGLIVALAERIG